jgi:hypothetical protein
VLPLRAALVDKTGTLPFEQVSAVAAAINLQVQRDLAPIWGIAGTVSALPGPDHIPLGVCPVFLVKNLPAGEGGVNLTRKHNQPYAKVELGDGWTTAASHEVLEMMVDPTGNRLYASNAIGIAGGRIQDVPGKFEYLVEIADPSEADAFGYTIDSVLVSDFYTPHFFDPKAAAGVRYSFTGAIQRPRDVLKGGYLSWIDPRSGEVQQLQNFDAPKIVNLGPASGASLREFVDDHTRSTIGLSRPANPEPARLARERGAILAEAAAVRARRYE